VRDVCTDDGVSAQLTVSGVPFPNGETISSGGPFSRYDAFLPPSTPTLLFDAPGFATSVVPTAIVGGSSTTEEVALAADVQLATAGAPQIGTSVQFLFDSVSDANRVYIGLMSVSGTSPGIPLNNCDIPLVFDVTTLIPTKAPAVFNGFVGFLDGSGSATGAFNIPGDPTLVGIDVDFAYFTIDVGSGLGIHASNAAHLLLQS
jgi:hypothetical protein